MKKTEKRCLKHGENVMNMKRRWKEKMKEERSKRKEWKGKRQEVFKMQEKEGNTQKGCTSYK